MLLYYWKLVTIFSYGDSVVKNPPANAGETGVAGLIPGREDSLGEEMAAH